MQVFCVEALHSPRTGTLVIFPKLQWFETSPKQVSILAVNWWPQQIAPALGFDGSNSDLDSPTREGNTWILHWKGTVVTFRGIEALDSNAADGCNQGIVDSHSFMQATPGGTREIIKQIPAFWRHPTKKSLISVLLFRCLETRKPLPAWTKTSGITRRCWRTRGELGVTNTHTWWPGLRYRPSCRGKRLWEAMVSLETTWVTWLEFHQIHPISHRFFITPQTKHTYHPFLPLGVDLSKACFFWVKFLGFF